MPLRRDRAEERLHMQHPTSEHMALEAGAAGASRHAAGSSIHSALRGSTRAQDETVGDGVLRICPASFPRCMHHEVKHVARDATGLVRSVSGRSLDQSTVQPVRCSLIPTACCWPAGSMEGDLGELELVVVPFLSAAVVCLLCEHRTCPVLRLVDAGVHARISSGLHYSAGLQTAGGSMQRSGRSGECLCECACMHSCVHVRVSCACVACACVSCVRLL